MVGLLVLMVMVSMFMFRHKSIFAAFFIHTLGYIGMKVTGWPYSFSITSIIAYLLMVKVAWRHRMPFLGAYFVSWIVFFAVSFMIAS